MTNDPLVPAPLCVAAICVTALIAFLLLGDATALYPTTIGSVLMHSIYDYPTWSSHDLVRYHDAEGDALFAVLAAPMLTALVIAVLYRAVGDVVARIFAPSVVPAE